MAGADLAVAPAFLIRTGYGPVTVMVVTGR